MSRKLQSVIENFVTYTLSRLLRSRSRLDNFLEHGAATLAYRRVILVLADASRKIPTALALQSRSLAHLHHDRRVAISGSLLDFDGGDDEEVAQIVLETLQHGEHRINRGQCNLRLQVGSDEFLVARLFQRFQHQ